MKKILNSVSLIACALVALYATGCTTAAGTIDAATTKVEIRTGKNKGYAIAFPKELQTTGFHMLINPKTGEIKLDADQLKSSSTGIIESAGVAQAQAMAAMSQTLNTALSALIPMLARAATGIDMPALPAVPQQRNPEPAAPAEPAPVQPFRPSVLPPLVLTPIPPIVVPPVTANPAN